MNAIKIPFICYSKVKKMPKNILMFLMWQVPWSSWKLNYLYSSIGYIHNHNDIIWLNITETQLGLILLLCQWWPEILAQILDEFCLILAVNILCLVCNLKNCITLG